MSLVHAEATGQGAYLLQDLRVLRMKPSHEVGEAVLYSSECIKDVYGKILEGKLGLSGQVPYGALN